ncbi:MAG: hypothetical protein ABIH52_04280 [Candidatus Aenigmatarchaeota archaeon]
MRNYKFPNIQEAELALWEMHLVRDEGIYMGNNNGKGFEILASPSHVRRHHAPNYSSSEGSRICFAYLQQDGLFEFTEREGLARVYQEFAERLFRLYGLI